MRRIFGKAKKYQAAISTGFFSGIALHIFCHPLKINVYIFFHICADFSSYVVYEHFLIHQRKCNKKLMVTLLQSFIQFYKI